jgi:peptide/nickel transport system permease protein
MSNNSLSPNEKTLRRLWKNRPAVIGLGLILFAILVAILGYGITPDKTPDVNEQNTEISLVSPRFETQMLAVRKNKLIPSNSWLTTIWSGRQNEFDNIAIKNYQFYKDSILVFTLGGDTISFSLPNVVYPLSLKKTEITQNGNELFFFDINEKEQKAELSTLQREIASKNIFTKKFYLGTDKFGRCMLSRLMIGVRVSLLVGLIAVVISLLLGISLGALAGYFGGKIDDFIMLIMNVIWSIPTVLLVFAIVLALGRGIWNIFFAVGLTMWVDVARMVRGQVLSLREMQYIEATKSFGYTTFRTIFKHILPNILGPVMVVTASNFATAILLEAGLSYLGFGIRPPTPSWGTMLNETYGYAISGKPILAMIPAFAIMVLVLAFNLLGNGIRDALDVKSKA